MKKLILFITICILTTSNLFAQIDWEPYTGNPVIDENFDTSALDIGAPNVLFDGTTYHMWYTREPGEDVERIGFATSPDGINWTLIDSLALEPSSDPNRFDSKNVGGCWVIKEGDTLKMWYGGEGQDIRGIGYAWSMDGHTWTKVDGSANGRSVYDETMDGANTLALAAPCVVKDGGTYHLWYFKANYDAPNIVYNIGYATSPNGLDWTNVSGSGTFGSVLDLGEPGKFDELRVLFPSVIKENSEFKMWYTGSDNLHSWRTGYAISNDGINWTKVDGNGTNGACFDDGFSASVIKIGDIYHMWYLGVEGVSYATSEGGIGIEDFNDGKISTSFSLAQNYPNPFNPTTVIEYNLPKQGHVKLVIYDLLGRHIRTLVDTQQPLGHFRTTWDGTDEHNRKMAASVYFCRLEVRDPSTSSGHSFVKVIKLALVK